MTPSSALAKRRALAPRNRIIAQDPAAVTPPASPRDLDIRESSQAPSQTPSETLPSSHTSASPGKPVVDDTVQQVLKQLQALRQGKPDASTFCQRLSALQWKSLGAAIAADTQLRHWFDHKLRSDWIAAGDGAGIFTARMPSVLHDTFADLLRDAIHNEVRRLGAGDTTRAALVQMIKPRAVSRTKMLHGSYKEADSSFTFDENPARLLVIEVDFAHNEVAREKAKRYIQVGTHAVVFFDLDYRNPTQRAADAAAAVAATSTAAEQSAAASVASEESAALMSPSPDAVYTVFRRSRTKRPDGKWSIRTNRVVDNESFLHNPLGCLELLLSDFCPTEFLSLADDGVSIRVPHSSLAEFLRNAQREQIKYDSIVPGLKPDEVYDSDSESHTRRATGNERGASPTASLSTLRDKHGNEIQDAGEIENDAEDGEWNPSQQRKRGAASPTAAGGSPSLARRSKRARPGAPLGRGTK